MRRGRAIYRDYVAGVLYCIAEFAPYSNPPILFARSVNATVFAEFIDRLAADAEGRKVFLIVDGHPSHRSKIVQRKLQALDGQVELFFLSPDAPELNPDELVWSHVKRQVGRSAVTSKDDLEQRLIPALRSLQKMPAKIMAFFHHPECRYAAMRLY